MHLSQISAVLLQNVLNRKCSKISAAQIKCISAMLQDFSLKTLGENAAPILFQVQFEAHGITDMCQANCLFEKHPLLTPW